MIYDLDLNEFDKVWRRVLETETQDEEKPRDSEAKAPLHPGRIKHLKKHIQRFLP